MSGLAIQLRNVKVVAKPEPPVINDLCRCDIGLCDYVESVFFSPSESSLRLNDFSTFTAIKSFPDQEVTISLKRNGVLLTNITNSDLGELINNSISKTWVASWKLIGLEYGVGVYSIVVAGVESRLFSLLFFDNLSTHNTIKLQFFNNAGSTIKNLATQQSSAIRVKGEVLKLAPELVSDKYYSSNYTLLQNREQLVVRPTIQIRQVPRSLYNSFTNSLLLSNYIYLDEYKIQVDNPLSGLFVIDTIAEPILYSNGLLTFEVGLRPYSEDTIKRNV